MGGGICDADYGVRKGSWICPYYQLWSSMFSRCYSKKMQKRTDAYIDCKVCDEWFKFSSFKNWILSQKQHSEWLNGKTNFELDKDILCCGNKIYSPETCVLVPHNINTLFTQRKERKNLTGVWFEKSRSKFCIKSAPTGKNRTLRFDSESEAHEIWKEIKTANRQKILDEYKLNPMMDERVVAVLQNRIECFKNCHEEK